MSRAAGPRVPILAGSGAGVWVVLLLGWGLAVGAWLAWARGPDRRRPDRPPHLPVRGALDHQPGPGPHRPDLARHADRPRPAARRRAGRRRYRSRDRDLAGHRGTDPASGRSGGRAGGQPAVLPLTPVPAAKTAIRLRPSLAGPSPRALPAADTGLLLGDLKRPAGRGPALFASWEDTLIAFMAPRSGKTTALGIPYVLSAPGAVVATSIKADLWAATAQLRAESGSTVWLFDPQRITGGDQPWWWNPLAGLATVEAAHRLASHFVLTIDDSTRRDLWGPAAQDLLCAVLLAAASSRPVAARVRPVAGRRRVPDPRRTARHSRLSRPGLEPARHAARRPGNPRRHLPDRPDRGQMPERRGHHALGHPAGWQDPAGLDPAAFAASRDTLYLLTESRSAASPLIAALTDCVMRAGRRQAERTGGRLDPPMVVVLDEAANICRIADLPELYSHLGSRGMVPVTILQSYQQGVAVWGEPGMAALWGASTKKVIGAGIDDPRHARDLATLVGQHDVPVASVSYGDGRASRQVSLRRQDILEAADIRALPPGSALLLATGARPALISLRPWYTGPHAARITAAIAQAEAAMRRAAQISAGRPARRPGPRSSDGTPGHDQPAGRRRRRAPAPAGLRQRGGVGDLPFPAHVPPPAGRGVPLVRAVVAARRGDHPAHRAVAQLGGDAAAAGHRHGHLAPRPPRPPAPRPARPGRAVRACAPRTSTSTPGRHVPGSPRLAGGTRAAARCTNCRHR